jgi:hypothetical protein
MISSQESDFQAREIFLDNVVNEAKKNGVLIAAYTMGVQYSQTPSGLGHTIDLTHLEPQVVYVTSEAWEEAQHFGLPITQVIQATIDHELIHEVHRSRIRRELSLPFDTEMNESIIHGVQLTKTYIDNRSKMWTPAVIRWLEGINTRVRTRYFTPAVRLAASKIPAASDVYSEIVKRINQEVQEPEYMKALGVI